MSSHKNGLDFPFDTAPAPGAVQPIADGVLWLRMPLPFALDHINVWALRDGDGWTLVDTGMQSRATAKAWDEAFAGALAGLPVTRVICTHMHPDHIGMAGWLTRRFACKLWITRLEYVICRMLVADTGREAPADALEFYRAAGWNARALEHYKARFGDFGRGVYALPDSYRRVQAGESIDIGGRTWQAVIGHGHSPEHLCLYSRDLKLLISGDQVLPGISSNVSVFPTEPEADPLGDWLSSLAAIRQALPDDVLVLPAHNLPFRGLHARLDDLIAGHRRALERLSALLVEPLRVVDVFEALYKRPIDGDELLGLATGEALAHLNYLRLRGRVERRRGADGVDRYRAIAAPGCPANA
ncbi:MBL fold metallo-hydrolase [Sinimarinibacterium thermocellulolyticum]|uniref:MBL fold metallo-hydrolase n=1 Tax=Sinimarinibacterium thermocellulolyticum TaxID=3170016 RepID=A0ABV2A7F5_9GAMM